MYKGDVLILGSFWGGGYQKNPDFRLELYEKRGRCYEFITLERTNNEDVFLNIYQIIICIFPDKYITRFSII